MRWLLLKDLQILRRSKLLVGLLVAYPIAIALLIGFALSSGPTSRAVAFLDEIPPGMGTIALGNEKIDVNDLHRHAVRRRRTVARPDAASRRWPRSAPARPWPR